ncbi:hypothetical protein YC2023_077799 [Brassica napus]
MYLLRTGAAWGESSLTFPSIRPWRRRRVKFRLRPSVAVCVYGPMRKAGRGQRGDDQQRLKISGIARTETFFQDFDGDEDELIEEAVIHVEDEPVIGEFHQDPDSDSSGDDDSERD